jgi:hypothetical protein
MASFIGTIPDSESGSGARVAIFTLGSKLRLVRGFTADSADLLASLIDPKSGTEAKFHPQLAGGTPFAVLMLAKGGLLFSLSHSRGGA